MTCMSLPFRAAAVAARHSHLLRVLMWHVGNHCSLDVAHNSMPAEEKAHYNINVVTKIGLIVSQL